jgi:ADP-ribosylglycohydrolase
MLLGIAIGDALGIATEGRRGFLTRWRYYKGNIRDYPDGWGHPDPQHGRGTPSDDTQMSFWLLEQMLADGRFVPENVARLFVERGPEIHGIGGVVRDFCDRGRRGGPWWDWAPRRSAEGNGALMRVAPIVLPHLKAPSAELWADTVLAARITHDGSASTASCVGLVNLVWQCLGRTSVPEPGWWLDEFVRMAGPLECRPYPAYRGLWKDRFDGPVSEFVRVDVRKAYDQEWTVRRACSPQGEEETNQFGEAGWSSSGYIMETVPSVLYVLMRHGDNFEEAIVRAVNDTRDNDTIASIVGAVLGALHGRKAIPKRWIDNLTGRTRRPNDRRDDGQVFRLIEQARRRWG